MAAVRPLPGFVVACLIGAAMVACNPPQKRPAGRDDRDDSDDSDGEHWVCGLDRLSSRCVCDKLKPDWESASLSLTLQCQDYERCLLTESETPSTTASCQCYDDGADCQAEASSRRATRVVSQCPPSLPRTLSQCAAIGARPSS